MKYLILVFLLVLGGVPAAAQPAPIVFTTTVEQQQISDTIEALGTLRANESVELASVVTETIASLHFDDGVRVKKGDVLVELTRQEESALLDEARAFAAEKEQQWLRVKKLLDDGAVPVSTADERRREYETAAAQLSAIESRFKDRLIVAPFDGVVGLRNLSVGALVEPGDLITTIDDDSLMKLDFSVPATFLSALKPGLVVKATSPALPDRIFTGEVRSVDSRINPITRAVVVRAEFDNKDRHLRPGQLLTVELMKDPRTSLVVPEGAIVPIGEKSFVFRLGEKNEEGYLVEQVSVKIGTRKPGSVEVLSGLKEGDQIVTDGTMKVRPGSRVRAKAERDRGSAILQELSSGEAA